MAAWRLLSRGGQTVVTHLEQIGLTGFAREHLADHFVRIDYRGVAPAIVTMDGI